jgi:hypothetical protein
MSAHDESPPGPGETSTPAGANGAEPRRLLDDPAAGAQMSAGAGGGADPSVSWAIGLLRGAEPYHAPAGRKQRVQLRLGHRPRRRAPLVLRFAVMAVVLFGFAAVVSAALGHWPDWMARAYERVVGEPPAARRAASARARVARRAPAAPAERATPTEDAEPAVDAPAAIAAPASTATPAERRPSRDVVAAPPRARRPAAAPPQPAGEDTSTVAAAMRALRVDKDPVRARGLLSRYVAEHPNGALAEEALAMSIEAAIAHHDADVSALAGRYLRLYPHGSFERLAREALARNAGVAQQPAPANADPNAP